MLSKTKLWSIFFTVLLLSALFGATPAQAAAIRLSANATTTAALNLRSGPGTNYAVQRVIPSGASVYVNKGPFNTNWYYVTYSSTSGYVFGAYLQQSAHNGGGNTTGTATTTAALNLRSGPGTGYAVLRVMPAGASVNILSGPTNGAWYKVSYAGSTGYAHGDYLRRGGGTGNGTGKLIVVDISDQWLYAYQNGQHVFSAPVSTGKDGFNTPLGSFSIFQKYPVQTMRGSMGGESWVVPDVPHVMYITQSGVALHGAYWHNQFGTGVRRSHGCINLPLDAAAWLYNWAPMGTQVQVRQ
jgi:uncharacterized protein YraI